MPIQLTITDSQARQTLAAIVRAASPGLSWSQAQRAIETRRVKLNNELILDAARRVKAGDVVELLDQSARLPPALVDELIMRHLDDHVCVVEKPSGLSTIRHPVERDWKMNRREMSPALEDRTQKAIAAKLRVPLPKLPRLRKVHRLDKLTSGLVVFARSALAERELGRQFAKHTVVRRYVAVVAGHLQSQTIRTMLVRDRGDGRRGSGLNDGKLAVTHVELVEKLPRHSLLSCRLETGRTHQIRIHLSELGHPLCGDPVYIIRPDGTRFEDTSGAPRLALHATELGFIHPGTNTPMHWDMELPIDLRQWLTKLR